MESGSGSADTGVLEDNHSTEHEPYALPAVLLDPWLLLPPSAVEPLQLLVVLVLVSATAVCLRLYCCDCRLDNPREVKSGPASEHKYEQLSEIEEQRRVIDWLGQLEHDPELGHESGAHDPEAWQVLTAPDLGRVYYYHPGLRLTTWDRPDELRSHQPDGVDEKLPTGEAPPDAFAAGTESVVDPANKPDGCVDGEGVQVAAALAEASDDDEELTLLLAHVEASDGAAAKTAHKTARKGHPDKQLKGAAAMPASSTLKPNGERHDVALSKLMSKLLRHTAKEYGVPVTRDGWVVLELVVAHVNTRAAEAAAAEEPPRVLDREYTREQVCEMITLNDKQRFELRQREDGTEEVRATLGHSMLDVSKEAGQAAAIGVAEDAGINVTSGAAANAPTPATDPASTAGLACVASPFRSSTPRSPQAARIDGRAADARTDTTGAVTGTESAFLPPRPAEPLPQKPESLDEPSAVAAAADATTAAATAATAATTAATTASAGLAPPPPTGASSVEGLYTPTQGAVDYRAGRPDEPAPSSTQPSGSTQVVSGPAGAANAARVHGRSRAKATSPKAAAKARTEPASTVSSNPSPSRTVDSRALRIHARLTGQAHSNSTAGRSLSRLPPPYRPPSHAVCNTAPTAPNARFQVVKGPSKRPQSARACQVVDTAAGLTTAGVSAHVKSVATARRVGGGQHADLRTSRTWLPFTSPLFIENDPDCLDDCDDFDYERAQMSRGWGEEFSAGRRTPTNQLPSNSSDASNSARGSESARSSSRRQPTAAQRPAANRATTARGSASQEDSHFEA